VRSRHARRTAAAALVLLVTSLLGLGALAGSAAAQTATTTSFTTTPQSPVAELAALTFHVVVTPAAATGTVAIVSNGTQIASAMVTSGRVDVTVPSMTPGSQAVQATFYPADAAAYGSSASATQVVQVVAQGHITLTVLKGSAVSPGGPVPVGSTVDVAVSGYPASSEVTAQLDSTGVTATFRVDSAGSGHALVYLARTLPSRVYRLTATSGRVVSSFAFYVYNPALTSSPTPTPAPAVPTATPTVYAAPAGIPATGRTPQLAHTGAEVAVVVPVAVALMIGGYLMLLWSHAPSVTYASVTGRHEVRRSGPRHARR
jgi:hypothetical protein